MQLSTEVGHIFQNWSSRGGRVGDVRLQEEQLDRQQPPPLLPRKEAP